MVWFKIDDGFWSHPKVLELSDAAGWLWVRAGSYCAQQLTDGHVTRAALRMLGGNHDAAVELVIAGLWDEADDKNGWVFHDWNVYQPTREQVLAERAAAAERKRQQRARQREQSQGVSRRDVQGTFGGTHSSPAVTRPDQTKGGGDAALSPFCERHPRGTDQPCIPCRNARLAFEAAREAERMKPTPTPSRPPMCPIHDEYPLPCDRCKREADEKKSQEVVA